MGVHSGFERHAGASKSHTTSEKSRNHVDREDVPRGRHATPWMFPENTAASVEVLSAVYEASQPALILIAVKKPT